MKIVINELSLSNQITDKTWLSAKKITPLCLIIFFNFFSINQNDVSSEDINFEYTHIYIYVYTQLIN